MLFVTVSILRRFEPSHSSALRGPYSAGKLSSALQYLHKLHPSCQEERIDKRNCTYIPVYWVHTILPS